MVALAQEDTTEIVYGEDKALRAYLDFLSRSAVKLDACGDSNAPSVDIGVKEYKDALLDCRRRGFTLRYITEITNDNVRYCKELAEIVELRHLDHVRANFAITENQFLTVGSIQHRKPFPMSIFSNVKVMVEQQQYVFDTLWSKAIPAEQRIREIEEDKPAERTNVIYDQESMLQTLDLFLEKIDFEVRLFASRPVMVEQLWRQGVLQRLASQKLKKNILIKLVASFGENGKHLINRISPHVQYKAIDPLPMSSIVIVRDKNEVLMLNLSDTEGEEPKFEMILQSSDKQIVETMLSSFEAWWNQFETNDRMMEEKTHAELLLDLITHDLGNHNQIIAPSLELALTTLEKHAAEVESATFSKAELEDLRQFLTSATRAFGRSVSLVDNVRRLEKMYKEKEVRLGAQDLIGAIESAISTVQSSRKGRKEILFSLNYDGSDRPLVTADNLLEEIFINLFANAVNATDGRLVELDVDIQEKRIAHVKYWMITVSDSGKGIPDQMKPEMFARFYSKAKGTGIGLSIVRALVERYKGKVWAGDRVANDHSKGARFGMILRDAAADE